MFIRTDEITDWLHRSDSTVARTNTGATFEMEAKPLSHKALDLVFGAPPLKFFPTPKRILRCGIATIVFWADGTKTVVKRAPDEPDNEYAAFTAALAIKTFGSNSKVKKIIRQKTEEQK